VRFAASRGLVEAVLQASGWATTAAEASGLRLADGPGGKAVYEAARVLVYRFSYPVVALGLAGAYGAWRMMRKFQEWQLAVRNEAYLIGERLHNFSGNKQGQATRVARARR